MKNIITSTVGIILVLSIFSAHAQKPEKVDICHNGSTIDPATLIESDISFVISISEKAVNKHIQKHDDCDGLFVEGEAIQECELQDDGITIVCEEKISCSCL